MQWLEIAVARGVKVWGRVSVLPLLVLSLALLASTNLRADEDGGCQMIVGQALSQNPAVFAAPDARSLPRIDDLVERSNKFRAKLLRRNIRYREVPWALPETLESGIATASASGSAKSVVLKFFTSDAIEAMRLRPLEERPVMFWVESVRQLFNFRRDPLLERLLDRVEQSPVRYLMDPSIYALGTIGQGGSVWSGVGGGAKYFYVDPTASLAHLRSVFRIELARNSSLEGESLFSDLEVSVAVIERMKRYAVPAELWREVLPFATGLEMSPRSSEVQLQFAKALIDLEAQRKAGIRLDLVRKDIRGARLLQGVSRYLVRPLYLGAIGAGTLAILYYVGSEAVDYFQLVWRPGNSD